MALHEDFITSMRQASADLEMLRGRLQELIANPDQRVAGLAQEIERYIENFVSYYTHGLTELSKRLQGPAAAPIQRHVALLRTTAERARQVLDSIAGPQYSREFLGNVQQYTSLLNELSNVIAGSGLRLDYAPRPVSGMPPATVLPGAPHYKATSWRWNHPFAETPSEIAQILSGARVITDPDVHARRMISRRIGQLSEELRYWRQHAGPPDLYESVTSLQAQLAGLRRLVESNEPVAALIPRARSVFGRAQSFIMAQMQREGSPDQVLRMVERTQGAIQAILDLDMRTTRRGADYYRARQLYGLLGEIIDDTSIPLRANLERRRALLKELGMDLADDEIAGMTLSALRQRRALAWRQVARARDAINLYDSLDRLYALRALLEQELPYVNYKGVLDPTWAKIDVGRYPELQALRDELIRRDRPPIGEGMGAEPAEIELQRMRDWWTGRYRQLEAQVGDVQRRFGLSRRQAIARVLRARSPYAQIKEATMMGSYLTLAMGQTTRIVPVTDILQSIYTAGGAQRLPIPRAGLIHAARGTPEEIARLLVALRSVGTSEAVAVEQRVLGLLNRNVRHRAIKIAQELQSGSIAGLVGQWVTFRGERLPFQVKAIQGGMAVVEPMTLSGLMRERRATVYLQGAVSDVLRLVARIPGTEVSAAELLDQAMVLDAIRKRGLPTAREPVVRIRHAAQRSINALRQVFEASAGFGAYAQDVSKWGVRDILRGMAEPDPVYGFRYGKAVFEALAAARPELFIDWEKSPDRLIEALQTAWVTAREIIDEDPTILQKPNWESLLRGQLQARAHGFLRGIGELDESLMLLYERAALAIRSGLAASRGGAETFEDFVRVVHQLPALLETMNLDDITKEEYLKLSRLSLTELDELWQGLERRGTLSLDAPLRGTPSARFDPLAIRDEYARVDPVVEAGALTPEELSIVETEGVGRFEQTVEAQALRRRASELARQAHGGSFEDVLSAEMEADLRARARQLGVRGADTRRIEDVYADMLEAQGNRELAVRVRREAALRRAEWARARTLSPDEQLEQLFRELAATERKQYKAWLMAQNAETIRRILPHVQGAGIDRTEEQLAGWLIRQQVAAGRDLGSAMEALLPRVAGQHVRIQLPGADPVLIPALIQAETLPSSISFHLEAGGVVQPLDRILITHNWAGAAPTAPGFRLGLSGYQVLASPEAARSFKVPAELLVAARQLTMDPILGDIGTPVRRAGMIIPGEALPFYRIPHAATAGLGEAAYSFPEVFASLDRLRPGAKFTAIDIETTGLPDEMRRAGLGDLFLPTEIGAMQYEVVEEGGRISFRPVEGTYTRTLVRPTRAQAERIMDIITRPEQIRAGTPEASLLAAYARFADPRYQDPSRLARLLAIEGGEAQLREAAAQGLEILRRKRTVTIRSAAKKAVKMLRGEDALVVGMNAARADLMWLTEWAKRQGISPPDVAVLDPLALARVVGKEALGAEAESLGALAQALGVPIESAHAAIARRGSRYVGDVPATVAVLERILGQHGATIRALREQMEGAGRLQVGDLLWAASRRAAPGADPIWRIASGWMERGGIMALALENVQTGARRVLSARNAGQLAAQLAQEFAYITPEEAGVLQDITARDLARREVARAYERRSSFAFALSQRMDERTRAELEREILQRSPAFARYGRYVNDWLRTDEGIAYRLFARRLYGLERAGRISPGSVPVALREYGAAITGAFGRPTRAPLSRFEALLTLEPEGMPAINLRLSSASNVEATLYRRARAAASRLARESGVSWQEAFETAVGRIHAAAATMGVVESGARLSLPELATRLYNRGISLFESGTLRIEDATVSRLSGWQDIRRARRMGESILRKYLVDPLPAPGTFIYTGPINELRALSGRHIDEIIRMAREGDSVAWWALGEAAYSPEVYERFPEGTRARARAAIGLGTGDPGDVILTHGKSYVGTPLRDVPDSVLDYHLRVTSSTPADLQEIIARERARPDRIPILHGRAARRAVAEEAEGLARTLFRESATRRMQVRHWVPWAVAGGIGLIIANQVGRNADIAPPSVTMADYAPSLRQTQETPGDEGLYGLDIQIRARNPGSANLEAAAYQLAYGIESQTGIPLNIQLTQRDRRTRIDRATVERILAAQLQ